MNKSNKKRIQETILKSITLYSCEVCSVKETMLKTTRATEVMKIKHSITYDTGTKQLIWFGHVQKRNLKWTPKQIWMCLLAS